MERIPFEKAILGVYEPCEVGISLGPTWSTHWFCVDLTIPGSMDGKIVYLMFDPSCEALVWSDQGHPLTGITGGNGIDRHIDYLVTKHAKANQKYRFWIEVAANGMFGAGSNTMIGPPDPNRTFVLKTAELVVNDDIAQSVYWDLEVMLGLVQEMPEQSQLGNDALYCANKVINIIIPGNRESLIHANSISKGFFETRKDIGYAGHFVTAIGNCHIDTAWLWPYDETKRKVARSWATQLRNLDAYPGYTFAASQMQQFEWLEQIYPSLFDEVKVAAKEGRFIPIGGTWVEMDCNIPSGEAFCRQFLYGQRYLMEKFGMKSSVFWLPDTFGYSSQLPQIVKSAGLEYFFTQKLSWNNMNKFPHTSFNWKGLDGTSVLTHFSPADTYTAQASVKDIVFMVQNNKDKLYSNQSLLLYGNGDGGGGALKQMAERINRFGNLAGFPAKVDFGNPEVFYKSLETNSHDLNTWKGELYFELHRGTYTTHALTKKYNRLCEYLLRKVELLYTIAILNKVEIEYPKAELDRLWKLVLLNQFHDVLPGSSIGMVYVDAIKFYRDVVSSGEKLTEAVIGRLSKNEHSLDAWTFFNPTSWECSSGLVQVPFNDAISFAQVSHDQSHGLVYLESVPAFGCVQVGPKKLTPSPVQVSQKDSMLIVNNGILELAFNQKGQLVRLFDLEERRELLKKDVPANVFRFYEDIPLFWDAWDVEIYHLEKGWDAGFGSIAIVEPGPLRVVLKATHPLSETSSIEQRIIISANSRLVEFENTIEWNENRKILKVEFPVEISNDMATYETQFGVLQRPTHANNSWDWSKFEVCGHKFVDFSEHGYGVALLNDCKYGFAVRENKMTMSILRAPKSPDETCDIGTHHFRYALYPHKGSFSESDVVQKGYQFNVPLIQLHSNSIPNLKQSIFSCNQSNLVLDTVKLAEDNQKGKDVVLRFYESYGGRGTAAISRYFNLTSSLALEKVCISNVLEETVSEIKLVDAKSFMLDFTPFKMITVLLKIK